MRTVLVLLAALACSTSLMAQDRSAPRQAPGPEWSLAIHGGAGTLSRSDMTPERDREYRAALQAALDAGVRALAGGGSALDAVQTVVMQLEDDARFNAGRGAVFTWDGGHELDAAIMDGRHRSAGAVAGVGGIRNPITLARKVMEESPHVMLSGKGAEAFAAEHGVATMPADWFDTEARREALEKVKSEQVSALDVDIKFGTVGAVARDRAGNLAAATSTGGMTGKRWNRIGDSPIIGAGTYADNRSCAVSATGWGEYFIRVGVAKAICDRRLLLREDMQVASDTVLAEVKALGGDGGVIVVSDEGEAVFSFNTGGMYRGRADSAGLNEVAIYADE